MRPVGQPLRITVIGETVFTAAIDIYREKVIPSVRYVYILQCSDKSLYTGVTKDIARRVSEHNRKKGSAYVQAHLPAKLAYKEQHKTKSKALKRESEIKRWTREKKLKLINARTSS